MSRSQRSRTHYFPRAQWLRGEPAQDGRAEFRQAQGGASQGVLPGAFLDELAILRHSNLKSWQLAHQFGDHLRAYRHSVTNHKRRMETKGCDEITGLKLPARKGTVDDFKPHGEPIRGFEGGRGIVGFGKNRLLQPENNLRLDFEGMGVCKSQRGMVIAALMYGVVIHVGPNQGCEFEDPPHGLVGITDLATDGPMTIGFAEPLECRFNRVSRVEIETGTRRREDSNCFPGFMSRQQFTRQIFDVNMRHKLAKRLFQV